MPFDPFRHHRESIRLPGYDYTLPGAYFLTLCIDHRECLLGDIENGLVTLSPYGEIIQSRWQQLPTHYLHVELDTFIVMPNHLHGIIILLDDLFLPRPIPKRHSIPEIVAAFKSYSAKEINKHRNTPGLSLWQRNYYEHIIRNPEDMQRIRDYIANNPANWIEDHDNPAYIRPIVS